MSGENVGNIPARYLLEDDGCYRHVAEGKYLGKYQGRRHIILTQTNPKYYHHDFEKGVYVLSDADDTPHFKRDACKTNSSSSSAPANSSSFNEIFSPYSKRFVLTHKPEGQVNAGTNNNAVNMKPQQQSGKSSAAGQRKTRKRKMRTRRYTSKRR